MDINNKVINCEAINKKNEIFCIHDQHVHSSYSMDSKEDIEKYINEAISKNCKYFVTTEHCDLNIRSEGLDWLADYKGLKELFDSFKKENKYNQINFLMGIEFGYKVIETERLNEVLKLVDYDIINMSIHDYDTIDFYFIKDFEKHGIDYTINKYFEVALEASESNFDYDVFSHIDYGFKTLYLYDKTRRISEFEDIIIKIMKNIIKNDKTFEINTKVQESINDDNHVIYLLKLYKSLGGKYVSLSSDAHTLNRYMSSFDKYKKIIKDCGYDYLSYYVKRKRYLYKI